MLDKVQGLTENIERVFLGKSDVVRKLLVGFFAGGHILIEDVPGVGKTLLAKTLAKSVDCSFQRIQFTPDLLPSDVVGVSIYNSTQGEFVFKHGPVFAHIILADEINRTTPRTQSSLLEAMNDFQVSVDGKTYELPKPFMVVATQNPHEFEGTYVLPENQLDRFMICMSVGYLDPKDEKRILKEQKTTDPLDSIKPVITHDEVLEVQRMVREVRLDDTIMDYVIRIANATRHSEFLQIGMSPRSSLHLTRAAQAWAFLEGRNYVIPDDVKVMAVPVIAHRVMNSNPFREQATKQNASIITDIIDATAVPV
jgi:MoxR-like ATPase